MRHLKKHWFLLAITLVLVIGAVWYEALGPIADVIPRGWLVASILLCMSCPMDLARSLNSKSAVTGALVGIGVSCLLAGPAGWLAGMVLSPEISKGLIIVALAPCTIATGAVWTRMGGGNEAVTLAVTVATNLLAFVVLPIGMLMLIGDMGEFSGRSLAIRLLMVVAVPVALGQALRKSKSLRTKFDDKKKWLSMASQIGLLGMVFIAATRNGEMLADPSNRYGVTTWVLLILAASLVHLVLFFISWTLARNLGVNRPDALAAGIGGSQKTLTVGLDVLIGMPGVAVLPMLVYHALQLFIDSFVVTRLGVKRPPAEDLNAGLSALAEAESA